MSRLSGRVKVMPLSYTCYTVSLRVQNVVLKANKNNIKSSDVKELFEIVGDISRDAILEKLSPRLKNIATLDGMFSDSMIDAIKSKPVSGDAFQTASCSINYYSEDNSLSTFVYGIIVKQQINKGLL